jgi:transcriptional regulator with XRE-family HTH domain
MKQTQDDLNAETLRGIGDRVRALRTGRGLTLSALSQQSQVSVAMLSHIERGRTSPSIKVLDRLRIALGVPLADFFSDEESRAGEKNVITRRHKRPVLDFDAVGLTKELLSPERNSELEFFLLKLDPGGNSGPDPFHRIGEKCGMVLAGRFQLTIADQQYDLDTGDAFQFDSSQPHSFRNLADTETQIIWVIRSREFG